MTDTWSIDAPAIVPLLKELQTAGENITDGYSAVATAFEDLIGGLIGVPGVAEAIEGVLVSEQDRMKDANNRIAASLFGTSTIVTYYVHADEHMMEVSEKEAAAAAETGDLAFFGQ
jgi:hypothetical protein